MQESGVLIILGNGHNLGMGLRTKYDQFASLYLRNNDESDFSESSKLQSFLVSSYQVCKDQSRPWSDMEGEIKRFALSVDVHSIDVEKERSYFESLIRDMGFYMNGETNYQFLCNHLEEKKDFQMSFPVFLLRCLLEQDKHYKILSFNYTNLRFLLDSLGKEILCSEVVNQDEITDSMLSRYIDDRVDVEYVHLTSKKCVLGIEDDPSVPTELSYLKKSYQFDGSDSYPEDYGSFKTIIVFGHSLGASDSDFVKKLFDGMMLKDKNDNPRFFFVTKDNRGKDAILLNLCSHLNASLTTIQKHLNYEFIIDDNSDYYGIRTSLMSALN